MIRCTLCDSPHLAGGINEYVVREECSCYECVTMLSYCRACVIALDYQGVPDWEGRPSSLRLWWRSL